MITPNRQPEPDIVGEEYGGKWIAWDEENIHIVASGATNEPTKLNALTVGVHQPTLEFAPPADAASAGLHEFSCSQSRVGLNWLSHQSDSEARVGHVSLVALRLAAVE